MNSSRDKMHHSLSLWINRHCCLCHFKTCVHTMAEPHLCPGQMFPIIMSQITMSNAFRLSIVLAHYWKVVKLLTMMTLTKGHCPQTVPLIIVKNIMSCTVIKNTSESSVKMNIFLFCHAMTLKNITQLLWNFCAMNKHFRVLLILSLSVHSMTIKNWATTMKTIIQIIMMRSMLNLSSNQQLNQVATHARLTRNIVCQ